MGSITISIEVELGWGMHDMSYFKHLSSDRSQENVALQRLLRTCDRLGIEITFDIVGHLLLTSCKGQHGTDYPEDWWANDPGTSVSEDPLFYAPDILSKIQESRSNHEICTHTFSHIDARKVTDELIERDIAKALSLQKKHGIETNDSIVMPRHRRINTKILKEQGINVIREPLQFERRKSDKYISLLKHWREEIHPLCSVKEDEGVFVTECLSGPTLTGSMLPQGQMSLPKKWKMIPKDIRKNMHTRFLIDSIVNCVDKGGHIHLWTHLYNMSNDPQWCSIKPALEKIGALLDGEKVKMVTMENIPNML